MRDNYSLVGRLRGAPVLRNTALRRTLVVVLLAICAMLTLFPERHRAALSLTPADPASLGLGDAVRQLGAINSVFTNQTAVEVSLKIARSSYVRDGVSKRLNLPRTLGKSPRDTDLWLERKVDIRALRGGILQFEATLTDGALARGIVAAYGDAVRQQLAVISRTQTAYKRQVLIELVDKASAQLARAQTAYDTYRLHMRASVPQVSIAAIAGRIPALEDAIRAKQVELSARRHFATDDNMKVRQVLAEIAALQGQLAAARSISPAEQNSVGRGVQESTEVDRLRRDLDLAQLLYDSYKRFLQGTAVEDLTSTATVRILEPAYVDSERQYNLIPLAAGLLILLLGLAIEFYGLRPPVGGSARA